MSVLRSYSLPAPWNRRDPLCSEAGILRAVIRLLEAKGCFVQRIECGAKLHQRGGQVGFSKSAMTGFPDVLCIHRGTVYGLEVKAPGGSMSEAQRAKLLAMQRAGAQVAVVVGIEGLWDWMVEGALSAAEVGGIDLVC